jgi:phage gp29-like protein
MADTTNKTAPLMQEVATTADGRDITIGYVDPLAVQPVRDPVLKIRGGGDYRVYSEVLRDDQVAACFGQRRLAVIGKNWQVDAGGTSRRDKKAAEFIRDQLNNVGWDRVTDRMLYGVYYGFAVSEAMYVRDGAYIALDNIKVRDRRRFGFDGLGRLRMKTPQQPLGELMPDQKFWAFATGSDHDDDPYGTGLGHWLYWPAFFKRNGLKYWLLFLEKFGQPTAKGTYGPNATADERNKLLQALSAIATDSGISIPQGMEIELIEAARSGTADYVALYDRMDAAIAKVILGQTASTQGTPGRLGNDDLQGDVRLDLIKADADLVCESFNRSIVKWLVQWNFPDAELPRVYRNIEPPEDLGSRAERDTKILSLGYKPTLQYIQQTYGDGFEEKQPEPVPAQLGQPSNEPASFAAAITTGGQPPSQMLEQARNNTEPVLTEWINQVKALADKAESLEQLQDQLLELYPDLSLDGFAAAMAQANSAAHLAGRNEVREQHGQQ